VPSCHCPAVTCNTTGDQTVGTVIQCATNTPMPPAEVWTYTYAVRTIAPGSFTNQAQVLYADSNPNNDNSPAPVTVKSTCGNPTGSGTRPPCPPGSVYLGPDTAVLDDPTAFDNTCCVSGVGAAACGSSRRVGLGCPLAAPLCAHMASALTCTCTCTSCGGLWPDMGEGPHSTAGPCTHRCLHSLTASSKRQQQATDTACVWGVPLWP
jgi:hypothetical protein